MCPTGVTWRCCSLARSPVCLDVSPSLTRSLFRTSSSVPAGASAHFLLPHPGRRTWHSSASRVTFATATRHKENASRVYVANSPQRRPVHTSGTRSHATNLLFRRDNFGAFVLRRQNSRTESANVRGGAGVRYRILHSTRASRVSAVRSAVGGARRGRDDDVFQGTNSASKKAVGMPLLSTGLLVSSEPRRKGDCSPTETLPRHSGSTGNNDGRGRSHSSEKEGFLSQDSSGGSRGSAVEEARAEDDLRGEEQVMEPSNLYVAAAAAATAALESMSRAERLMGEAAKAAAAAQSLQAGRLRWKRPQGAVSPGQAAELKHALLHQVAAAQQRAAEETYTKAGVALLQVAGRTGKPTQRDLWLLSLSSSLPFVGFGLVDNFVMIVAGDMFDTTLCVALGLSTMTAAALGNWISDLMGLWLGSTIERVSSKALSIPKPHLTKEEMESPLCRRYYYIGTGLGISLGCLLGMAPLLFLDTKEGERLKQQREQAKTLHTDVAEAIAGYLRAERVVIYLLDPQEKAFRTEIDGHPVQIPLDAGIPGRVYATGLLVNWRPSFPDDASSAAAPASPAAAAEAAAAKERRASGAVGGLSPLCIGGSALPQPADLLPCCPRADRVAAAAEAAAVDGGGQGEESSSSTTAVCPGAAAAAPGVAAASTTAPGPTAAGGAPQPVAAAGELATGGRGKGGVGGGAGAEALSGAAEAGIAGSPREAAAGVTAAAATTTVAVREVVGKERIEKVGNLQQWAKVLQEKVLYAWRDNISQSGQNSKDGKSRELSGGYNIKEGPSDSSPSSFCRDAVGGATSSSVDCATANSSSSTSDRNRTGGLRSDRQKNSCLESFQKINSEVAVVREYAANETSAVGRPPAACIAVAGGAAATAGEGAAAAAPAAAAGVLAGAPATETGVQSNERRGFSRWLFSVSPERSGAAAESAGVAAVAEVKAAEAAEAAAMADAAAALEAAAVAGTATTQAGDVKRLYTVMLGRRWVDSAATRNATGLAQQQSCGARQTVGAATIKSTVTAAEEVVAMTAATVAASGAAEEAAGAPVIAAAVVAAAEAAVSTTREVVAPVEGGGRVDAATECPGDSAAVTAAAAPITPAAADAGVPHAGAPAGTGAASTGFGSPARETASVGEAAAAAALVVVQAAGAGGAPAVAAAPGAADTRDAGAAARQAAAAGGWHGTGAAEERGGLGRYREAPTTDFPVNEAAAPRRECQQILGAPIFGFDGDIIGVVEVINPVDRLCFSRKDKEFLLSICPHIAVEVEGRQHLTNILEMCRKQVSSHKKKSKKNGGKGAADASSSSCSSSRSSSGDDEENSSGSPADSISLFANKFFS